MAINLTDFDKIWASTSPLTPYAFSDANYQQGWNFVGATPPARQMWDSYMKWSDEKQQYIVNNFLPLAGGTMTGILYFDRGSGTEARIQNNVSGSDASLALYGGEGYTNGAHLVLSGKNRSTNPGAFSLNAKDDINGTKTLLGNPDGTLTWNGNTIPTKNVNIQVGKTESTSVSAGGTAQISISFSPSFSSNPVVFATVQTNYAGFYASVGSVSTSGASISVNNTSSNTRSVVVGWVAISI